MQGPKIKGKLEMLRHLDPEVGGATGKILNKIKISSLGSLGLLGVSPNVQVISRRGSGQEIPSFAEGVSIRRPKGILGLVRGLLVRGTSARRGLLQRSHRIRRTLHR